MNNFNQIKKVVKAVVKRSDNKENMDVNIIPNNNA
jgi:hypothetical protein